MSDQWGTREQPSERDPGRIRAEHLFLIAAAFSLAAALAAYTIDATLPIDINRGAYAITVSFFTCGICGWLSRSAERRSRECVSREHRWLAAEIEDLREQLARQKMTYLPHPRQHNEGQRHVGSVAAGAEDDAAPHTTGIDGEAIDALRRINSRLRKVDSE